MSTPLVVVDADVLGRQRTGDESYVENLLRELPRLAPDLRLAAITRNPERVPAGVEPVQLSAGDQIVRMAVRMPRLLRRLRPDVAHFQYAIPLGWQGASVVTVHDLSFEGRSDLMRLGDRIVFRLAVPRSVRRARRVLTVSEFTRGELLRRYGLGSERIVVTPNGVDPAFGPAGPARDGPAYALFVGALEARKDPLGALSALALVPGDLRLVLAGPDRGLGDAVRAAVFRLGLAGRVDLVGHVDKQELARLYRGAACLVFPSRYEGFGLPVLEAMACGTPVVATTAPAIPEIAGDAALLVPPGQPAALAGAIERALADRDRLVAAGLERARGYTWEATARATLAVYRELLG